MESRNNKMATILVAEIKRMNEENKNLNSMLKRMSNSYTDLQNHIRCLLQKNQQLTGDVDGTQIFKTEPDNQCADKFSFRILSPRSVDVDSGSADSHQSYSFSDWAQDVRVKEGKMVRFMDDQQLPSKKRKINYIQLDHPQGGMVSLDDSLGAVSQQSYNSSDCLEQVRDKDGKKAKFMDDQRLPSKKRKVNYSDLNQTSQKGTTVKSSMDDILICDETGKKKRKALSKGSNKQMTALPKNIVSVPRGSEASAVIIDAGPLDSATKLELNKFGPAPSLFSKLELNNFGRGPLFSMLEPIWEAL